MSAPPAYLLYACAEVALVGLLCAVVGVHVVLRRRAFFTMAMTHATFPGVVLASLAGVNLYLGAGLVGLAVVALVVALGRRRGQDGTAATGVVLSAGFALGVVLVSSQPGFTRDLSSYLVGSLLTVQPSDLGTTAVLGTGVVVVLALVTRPLLFAAFDPVGAVAAGHRVAWLDAAFLVLVEVTVVVAVPAVGTILSVALVVAPAAAARLWVRGVGAMTALAAAFGIGSGLAGLLVSQYAGVAAGAAVTLVATVVLLVSLAASRAGRLVRRRAGRLVEGRVEMKTGTVL